MKLWVISQDKNNDYDTYDSAIVAAETEELARVIAPGDGAHYWSTDHEAWCSTHNNKPDWGLYGDQTWTHIRYVKVEYIGEAKEGTQSGVIVASFNAG
jgi:hypothetical protein